MRGLGAGIQGATSAVGWGGSTAGGHRMIPKDCKRLAEVDFPIAEVPPHVAHALRVEREMEFRSLNRKRAA